MKRRSEFLDAIGGDHPMQVTGRNSVPAYLRLFVRKHRAVFGIGLSLNLTTKQSRWISNISFVLCVARAHGVGCGMHPLVSRLDLFVRSFAFCTFFPTIVLPINRVNSIPCCVFLGNLSIYKHNKRQDGRSGCNG